MALAAVKEWLILHPGVLEGVVFNVFTLEDYDIYANLIPQYFDL